MALEADLNKPKLEVVVSELLPIVSGCKAALEKLEEWAAPVSPQVPEWRQSFDVSVHPVPKGVTLMISSVVLLFLSLERLVDDNLDLSAVRGTILSSSPFSRSSVQLQRGVPW